MTVLHTGSTKQYSSNWESIFTGREKKRAATTAVAGKSSKKTPAKKKKPAKRGR
jgi:hypothetical protein